MEEIKVNEYVRTRGGHIRKVSKIMPCYENELLLSDTYYIEFDEEGNISTYKNKQVEEFITKHSFYLIDLIEKEDYVNGYKVIDKYLFAGEKLVLETAGEDTNCKCLTNEDIKNVVTKEQFNQMKYIVGDESNVKD